MKPSNHTAFASLILAMFVFGTIGVFRKYIPLSSGILSMLRGYIGAAFLFCYVALKGQRFSFQKLKKHLIPLILSGGFIGFNWILLFEAYRYTSVAVATLCYYMAPVFVIIVSPFVLKEKLSFKKFCCLFLALLGMLLVSGVLNQSPGQPGHGKGVLLGLGAAFLYACVILLNKKTSGTPIYDKTILQLIIAAAVITPYTFLTEDLTVLMSSLSVTVIVLVLVVGIVHTGISYALYFGSIPKLKAQTAALFSYIDPITAILLSAFLLKEPMTLLQIAGTIFILFAAIYSEMPEKRPLK